MKGLFGIKYIIFCGLFMLVVFFSTTVTAQDEDEVYSYSREFVWGVSKSTNSGLIAGLAIKFGRRISENRFQSLGVEIVNIKHPREVRYPSSISGSTFIWGKQNYLFSIRPNYGREWVIFKKAPQQGVQINAILAGGPSLGLVAPYYIRRRGRDFNSGTEPWNPNIEFDQIDGSGPFLKGLGDASIVPGANVKAGVSFEFGTFKNDVTGFEVGFQLDAYTRNIVIMPAASRRSLYPAAYIMLFYGNRQ